MPGNGLAGIDEGFKGFRGLFAIVKMDADLRNAIGGSIAARGFYVNDGVHCSYLGEGTGI